jgi:hypothetical protein
VSVASALARGQAAALALMQDACTIRRRGEPMVDDFSGETAQSWASLYAGPCRVQQGIAQADEQDAGEDYQLRLRLVVQLPVSVTALEVEDEITITAAAHDPDLAGRVFLVRDLMHKTHPTARRVGVVERTD